MVDKSLYYAEINRLDHVSVAPSFIGGVLTLTGPHADAINAIADDDPAFIAWQNLKIEKQREVRFRTEVDGHYLRQVEAEITGGTPDYASCMAMKAQIRLDLPYKV